MQTRNEQRTALVVDYDVWARKFTTDVLASQGYVVLGASNGVSGLRLAEQHSCDVILLDLALPELHGLELLERLRTMVTTREVPVIVLGATPTGEGLAAQGCVPKPLEEVRVLSEVGRCLFMDRLPVQQT